jgi:hypothetical protein
LRVGLQVSAFLLGYISKLLSKQEERGEKRKRREERKERAENRKERDTGRVEIQRKKEQNRES